MDVQIFDNAEQIGIKVGSQLASAIRHNPKIVLGLATGASPIPTYDYLSKLCSVGELSFKDVTTFNLDEYCHLPRENKNSYYSFMNEHLFSKTDIHPDNIHFLDGNTENDEKECERYNKMLVDAGLVDIQLLGIGTNGHIGFNEPAEKYTKGAFKIALTESTRTSNSVYFDENPMPTHALTMGIGNIMSAKKIIMIATGEKKQKAVKAMIEGEVTPKCPASILQFHPSVTVYLDKAAAALL